MTMNPLDWMLAQGWNVGVRAAKKASPSSSPIRGLVGCAASIALLLALMAGVAHAASTGSLRGTITDPVGNPIATQDICVIASPAKVGSSFSGATSDASGHYEITGLVQGSYWVYAEDCFGSSREDVRGYYEVDGAIATLELGQGQTKAGIDVKIAPATSIAGHVYGGAGNSTPLANVCVEVFEADSPYQRLAGSASTDVDGAYTVTELRSNVAYKLEFNPCSPGSAYAADYYDGKGSFAEADILIPTVANPSTGIDGHLLAGASIAGTVTDAEGNPITTQDVCVGVSPHDNGYSYTGNVTTNASGEYKVSGLPAGSYYVRFADCGEGRDDVAQYFGGAPNEVESTLVVLSTGGAKTGVDAQLAAGTSIGGHIYDGAGTDTSLGEQCVYVNSRFPSGANGYYYSYYAETGSSGSYEVGHVAPVDGGYTVEFADCAHPATHVRQYFGGSYDQRTASPVAPTTASPAQGVDAHLETGGTITGRITDSKGVAIGSGVCAMAALAGIQDAYYSEYTSELTPSGEYTISGLPTGSYDLYFYDCGSRNDVSLKLSNAAKVTVGAPTKGIDTVMRPATSISGHVYGGNGTGTPLGGICIQAYNAEGGSIGLYNTGSTQTGTDGSYALEHLDPAGSYVVEFNVCSYGEGKGYAMQFYDGVSELSRADVLDPTLAAPSTGIDAHLPSGPPVTTITGGPAPSAVTSTRDTRFSFTSNVAGATFECAFDGEFYSSCSSPYDGYLAVGRHTFAVRATANGETESSPRFVTWTVDPSSPESTFQGQVGRGETFSSNPGGHTSSARPVMVSVTPPSASRVTLTTEPATTPTGNGYTIFGQQIGIAAAEPGGGGTVTGTVGKPIKLVFTLDVSQIPVGMDPASVTVTRNGIPAVPCATPGTASPDPCVDRRSVDAEGDLEIIVLTTHCSTWNFATPFSASPEQPAGNDGPADTALASPASPASTGGPAGGVLGAKAASGEVSFASSAIAVQSHGEARVRLSCTDASACTGWLTLTVKRRIGKGKKRRIKEQAVGTARYSIEAGRVNTVALKLTATGRALLAAAGYLTATLTIRSSPAPSTLQSWSVRLTQKSATRAKRR